MLFVIRLFRGNHRDTFSLYLITRSTQLVSDFLMIEVSARWEASSSLWRPDVLLADFLITGRNTVPLVLGSPAFRGVILQNDSWTHKPISFLVSRLYIHGTYKLNSFHTVDLVERPRQARCRGSKAPALAGAQGHTIVALRRLQTKPELHQDLDGVVRTRQALLLIVTSSTLLTRLREYWSGEFVCSC